MVPAMGDRRVCSFALYTSSAAVMHEFIASDTNIVELIYKSLLSNILLPFGISDFSSPDEFLTCY